jgi:hypothetical protein
MSLLKLFYGCHSRADIVLPSVPVMCIVAITAQKSRHCFGKTLRETVSKKKIVLIKVFEVPRGNYTYQGLNAGPGTQLSRLIS